MVEKWWPWIVGVLLPHAIELNRKAAWEKYEALSATIGTEVAEFARTLLQEFDVATNFGDAGLRREGFPEIVAEAMTSGSTKASPKEITEQDVRHLLEAVTG